MIPLVMMMCHILDPTGSLGLETGASLRPGRVLLGRGVELFAAAQEVEHGASLEDRGIGLDVEGDGLSEPRERERCGIELALP